MSDPTNIVVLDCKYWMRISVVVKVCLKEALLDILHDPTIGGLTKNKHQLYIELINFKVREEKNLKGVIKPFQWDKLCHVCTGNCPAPCPNYKQTDSKDLDITCIVILIIQLTNLPAPLGRKGWKQALPQIGDTTKGAFVLLCRQIRNDLIHCSLQTLGTQNDFDDFWNRIKAILLGLGYQNMTLFNGMKTASLDPYIKQQVSVLNNKYQQITLQKCDKASMNQVKNDIQAIQKTASKLDEKLKQSVGKEELQKHLDVLLQIQQDIAQKLGNVEVEIARTNMKVVSLLEKFDTFENKNNFYEHACDYKKISDELKNQTKKRYGKVKVCLEPKTSARGNVVDRDDIIVEVSLKFPLNFRVNDNNIEQIENASNKVHYSDIVNPEDEYIVILGVPGCGKTTLVETLLFKWASNELWNDGQVKFDFVFVIAFRRLARFKKRSDITAEQILSFFYPDYDFQQIFKLKDSKPLLILEGFDELSGKRCLNLKDVEQTSFIRAINDLLDPINSRLPFVRIVTSRPGSFDTIEYILHPQPFKTYELSGFSDASIVRYIQKHFPQEDQATKVTRKLKDTPVIYDMMVVPFYCWGICYLIKNDVAVEEFAQTYTALYGNLIALFIRNHGFRNPSLKLNDILRYPKFKETCLGLAELAWQLDCREKLNFTQQDLHGKITMEELIRESGLIVEIESDDIIGSSPTYQFLHYTFQEYLVALHMYNSEDVIIRYNIIDKQSSSMLAGLIGGSLPSSESPIVVKKVAEVFAPKNTISLNDIIKTNFCEISTIFFLSLSYEFHNNIDINHSITLRGFGSYSSPYTQQCISFLKLLHSKDKLCFLAPLTVDFRHSGDDLDHAIALLSFLDCDHLVWKDSNVLCQHLSRNDLSFRKISLTYNCKENNIPSFMHHTQTLEILNVVGREDLKNIFDEFEHLKQPCKTTKLVFYLDKYSFHGCFDWKNLLDNIDVCEEIVFGFADCTTKSTRSYPGRHIHCKTRCTHEEYKQYGLEIWKELYAVLVSATKEFRSLTRITIGIFCKIGTPIIFPLKCISRSRTNEWGDVAVNNVAERSDVSTISKKDEKCFIS